MGRMQGKDVVIYAFFQTASAHLVGVDADTEVEQNLFSTGHETINIWIERLSEVLKSMPRSGIHLTGRRRSKEVTCITCGKGFPLTITFSVMVLVRLQQLRV